MRNHNELTLRNQSDFIKVYKGGKSQISKLVVVLYYKNELNDTRTAFVASKKVGNSVKRNRARRLMRAAYESVKEKVKPGYDIVFVARNSIKQKKENEVEKAIFGAMRTADLFRT